MTSIEMKFQVAPLIQSQISIAGVGGVTSVTTKDIPVYARIDGRLLPVVHADIVFDEGESGVCYYWAELAFSKEDDGGLLVNEISDLWASNRAWEPFMNDVSLYDKGKLVKEYQREKVLSWEPCILPVYAYPALGEYGPCVDINGGAVRKCFEELGKLILELLVP